MLLEATSFPLVLPDLTVESLGTIKPRPRYYTSSTIFPVGFRTKHDWVSIGDIKFLSPSPLTSSEQMTYISEIVDGGNSGPLFRVTSEGDEGESFEAASASGVWRKVLQRVNSLRVMQSLLPLEDLPGPSFFGLSNPDVQRLVEGLEGAAECDGYVFLAYRRHRTHGVPQGDGQEGSESEFEFVSEEEEPELEEEMDREEEAEQEEQRGEPEGPSGQPEEEVEKEEEPKETMEHMGSEKRQKLMETMIQKVLLLGNDTKLRVRCRRVEGGFKAEDTFLCEWRGVLIVERSRQLEGRKRTGGRVRDAPRGRRRIGGETMGSRVVGKQRTTGTSDSTGRRAEERRSGKRERRRAPADADDAWRCFRKECCS